MGHSTGDGRDNTTRSEARPHTSVGRALQGTGVLELFGPPHSGFWSVSLGQRRLACGAHHVYEATTRHLCQLQQLRRVPFRVEIRFQRDGLACFQQRAGGLIKQVHTRRAQTTRPFAIRPARWSNRISLKTSFPRNGGPSFRRGLASQCGLAARRRPGDDQHHGSRLAAEDGVSDDARRNEPWKSQGPLGEGGSEAEETVGTQWPETIGPHVLNEGGSQPTRTLLG